MIKERLDLLCEALHNKLEREWPDEVDPSGALPVLLRAFVLVSHNTQRSIRYLIADWPEDPFRRPEYAVSILPLLRTLVDALFNLVFLLEDPSNRQRRYWRGSWRELKETLLRFESKYVEDAAWQDWFQSFRVFLDEEKRRAGISDSEAENHKKIAYWPIPSQMLKDPDLLETNREFLNHLNAWFYRIHSSASHQSGPGLMARAAGLIPNYDEDARIALLAKLKSDGMFTATTLLIAVVSEVLGFMSFELRARARFIWGVLASHWPEAKELYEMRYDGLLRGSPTSACS